MSSWSLFLIVTLPHATYDSHGLMVCTAPNTTFKASSMGPESDHLNRRVVPELLPKALNVATCSHMSPGWSGRGCHTRASTSCRRQRQGISDGSTSTVNRYWWLLRFTWRDSGTNVSSLLDSCVITLVLIIHSLSCGSWRLVDKSRWPLGAFRVAARILRWELKTYRDYYLLYTFASLLIL